MYCLKSGHKYKLNQLDGEDYEQIAFVDRGHNTDSPGTTNQEVLRVLIDRIIFLDSELPWSGNQKILKHLRLALVLHEARHLERLVDRDILKPELLKTGKDGHIIFRGKK